MERHQMKAAPLSLLALLCACAAGWAAPAHPLDTLRLEDLSATRERPLFAPTRRPPPPPQVEAAPEAAPVEVKAAAVVAEPPPFDLVGSVIGPDAAFALLRNKTTSQVIRLRSGDDAQGWRVGEIAARSVALERDGRRESLALAAPQPLAGAAQLAGDDTGQPDPAAEPPPPPTAPVAQTLAARPPFIGMRPQQP
jgi:hypothetical protein